MFRGTGHSLAVAVIAGSVIRARHRDRALPDAASAAGGFRAQPVPVGAAHLSEHRRRHEHARLGVAHLVKRFGFRSRVSGRHHPELAPRWRVSLCSRSTTPHILIAVYLFYVWRAALRPDDRDGRAGLFRRAARGDVQGHQYLRPGAKARAEPGVGISASLLAALAGLAPITVGDFKIVFITIALLMASSAIGFRRLKPEDGWQGVGLPERGRVERRRRPEEGFTMSNATIAEAAPGGKARAVGSGGWPWRFAPRPCSSRAMTPS